MITAGVGMALVIAACGGGGSNQAAKEPRGRFSVDVSTANFPAAQRLAQHAHLVIVVRNTGRKPIPDVAVTLCNVTCTYPAPKGEGTSAAAFGSSSGEPYLANSSRPIWIVDRPPGQCAYSCQNGGQGGGVTAYSNTWALGRLAPGRTARFDWAVTAVKAGHHVVAWQVAAGLNGKARAVGGDGSSPHGTFAVTVDTAPAQTYVGNNGQISTTSATP